MNANKIIHEARGLKWKYEDKSVWNCKCDCIVPSYPTFRKNKHVPPCEHAEPDYTDPVHYCELMDWMREESLHAAFGLWLKSTKDISMSYHWLGLPRQEKVNLIAQAIEEGVLK
jgi:hypothetical protein